MIKKKIHVWASDYSDFTGEGNLARLFINHKLKKKYSINICKFKTNNYIANKILGHKYFLPIIGVINCCSGNPIRLGEFLKNYCDMMGINIEIKSGLYPENDYEPRAFWGKRGKMNKILNNE